MSFDSSLPVLAVCFNEAADQIVSGGLDNSLKVWDIRTNGLLYEMKGHVDSPTGLSLSPDGAYVASNAMDSTRRYFKLHLFLSFFDKIFLNILMEFKSQSLGHSTVCQGTLLKNSPGAYSQF